MCGRLGARARRGALALRQELGTRLSRHQQLLEPTFDLGELRTCEPELKSLSC